MRDSTGTGVYSDDNRPIIHFGSPEGSQYGDKTKAVVTEFIAKHPDFVIEAEA